VCDRWSDIANTAISESALPRAARTERHPATPPTLLPSPVPRKFEDRVEELRRATETPTDPTSRKHITKALDGKNGYLISLAAKSIQPSDPDLLTKAEAAFRRLLEDATKRDPQCHGKNAIAQRLFDAEIRAHAVFEAGVKHIQPEPVLGGRQDTAGQLRGICIMALVHGQHPRALVEAARLLADPERPARVAAARALVASGAHETAEPLLRLRLEIPEDDPEALSEYMAGLLELNPSENLDVIAAKMDSSDVATAEAAALALGSSRVAGAFEHLSERVADAFSPNRRSTLLLAIAMLRTDTSWQYLIERIMEGPPGEALPALDALATFKEQPGLRDRVEAAVLDNADPDLHARFNRAFKP